MKYYLLIWFVKLQFPKYWFLPTSLIYAQAIHETGNFTSSIFKENYNLFGMKQSFKTPGGFIELGTKRGHAYYKNMYDSVKDYFIRQLHFNINYENITQYINDTFASGYAEDSKYKERWQVHYNNVSIVFKCLSYIIFPAFLYLIYSYLKKKGGL